MKKTLVLTVLILLLGSIGTLSAQSASLTHKQTSVLKHNYLVSKHVIAWHNQKGRWTLFPAHNHCSSVSPSSWRKICVKHRHMLKLHEARMNRIAQLFHPVDAYQDGGYNWEAMVDNCEAHGSGWYADTGNGFFFGPQFTRQTWHGSGGGPVAEMGDRGGLPMHSYSIPYIRHIAYNTMKLQGPGAWPNCHGYL